MLKTTILLTLACAAAYAQLSPSATWAVQGTNRYVIKPNITYGVRNNFETKLDIYQRRDITSPQPTLIFIHGGGWTGGSKETPVMSLLPWLELGWDVVNVENRLAPVALGAAAVRKCLGTSRWGGRHST